jgi:repressor LexA
MRRREAGTLDGALGAGHPPAAAENGQIVVARLEDEVTVKRFRRHGQRVSLLAENPDFAPIEVDLRSQTLAIEGLAGGVVRVHLQ